MSVLELSKAFNLAKALRVPLWSDEDGPKPPLRLSGELGEYMLLSAFYAGELHEERLEIYAEQRAKQEEWDHLEGWEPFRNGKTDSSREEAKRLLRPELWDELQAAKWVVARLTDEIDRLNRDAEKAVSRAYTMLTGT